MSVCKYFCIFAILHCIQPMKTSTKITLSVLGTLFVLIFSAFLFADIWVSLIAQSEIRKSLSSAEGIEASIGPVHIYFISGSVVVKDFHLATEALNVDVEAIQLNNIRYMSLLKQRIQLHSITIEDPHIRLVYDDRHPEAIFPQTEDTTLRSAGEWLHSIGVKHLLVNRACAYVKDIRSPLEVKADSLSVHIQDLHYNLTDSVFTYNDEAYAVSLTSLSVALPDGMSALEMHDFGTRDQGPITLGHTRFYNTIPPMALADRVEEPVTWIDVVINQLTTSPLNPIRKALAQDFTLEKIDADVALLHAARDERHAPKKPYDMPQEILQAIPATFSIGQVGAKIREVQVEFASTDINCGHLRLNNIKAHMENVTNKAGAVWKNSMIAPVGKEGQAAATFNLYMNPEASFDGSLHATHIETDYLNTFIRPLVGITSECHIDSLDTEYGGDKVAAQGTFCMRYHGLNIQVHKEDNIPYKVVSKHAKTLTTLANTLIPSSNPTSVDVRPRAYHVAWKRDIWSPVPLYYFGPCINGVVETMLPGLYVHKQVARSTQAK